MNNKLSVVVMSVFLLATAACSPQQAVILVPDRDGHIGKAEVSTDVGKQLLEKPGDMTQVSGPSEPPSKVVTASPEYISRNFSEVLAIEPLPPEKFILYFESGRTVLTNESQAMIDKIAAASKRRGSISISISGHTDATGSDLINDRLASKRADFVKELLLQSGIRSEQLTVSSHEKGNPLVPTPDVVSEPRNRRVEVLVR